MSQKPERREFTAMSIEHERAALREAVAYLQAGGIDRDEMVLRAEDAWGNAIVVFCAKGRVATRNLSVTKIFGNPAGLSARQIEAGFGSLTSDPEQDRKNKENGLTTLM